MTFEDRLSHWFRGHADAVHFAMTVWEVAQSWDDLKDTGSSDQIENALSWLAFGKEYNPFFAQNAGILRPALLQMYLQWQAANSLERGSDADVEKAWMLRAGYYGVLHTIAWMIGGDGWARRVGPDIYRTYGETLADFKKEMADA